MDKTVVLNVVGLTQNFGAAYDAVAVTLGIRGKKSGQTSFACCNLFGQATYLVSSLVSMELSLMAGTFGMSGKLSSGGNLDSFRLQGVVARFLDPTFTCANLFWWYSMYSRWTMQSLPDRCIPQMAGKSPIFMPSLGLRSQLKPSRSSSLFNFWGPQHINSLQPVDCRGSKVG